MNRTELPRGPSVTTRIETCQATSSRSSSVSHSARLQLRTSIDAGEARKRAVAVEHVPHRRGEEPDARAGCAEHSSRQAVGQRGDDAQVARPRCPRIERCRLEGRVAAAKADRQLVAELAARDEQGPVRRLIGNANRVVGNAELGQPLRDHLARRVGFRSQSAVELARRARRRSRPPSRPGRRARRDPQRARRPWRPARIGRARLDLTGRAWPVGRQLDLERVAGGIGKLERAIRAELPRRRRRSDR